MKGYITVSRTWQGASLEIRNDHGQLETHEAYASVVEAEMRADWLRTQRRYAEYKMELPPAPLIPRF